MTVSTSTNGGASCEPRHSSSGGQTPTSTTVTLPYRAAETTEPSQDRTERGDRGETSHTGPRQRSGTDLIHGGGGGDIESGAVDSRRDSRRDSERQERSFRRANSNPNLNAQARAEAGAGAVEETQPSNSDGVEV